MEDKSIDIYNLMKVKQSLMLANQIIQELKSKKANYDHTGIKIWNNSYKDISLTVEALINVLVTHEPKGI